MEVTNIYVDKKNHTHEEFSDEKLMAALNKTAVRVLYRPFDEKEAEQLLGYIKRSIIENIPSNDNHEIYVTVDAMHAIVEEALKSINAKGNELVDSYMKFRNWKSDYAHKLEEVKEKIDAIYLRGDKSNANTDASYVSTKRCLGYNILNKELYQMNFMNADELQACKDGYLYAHDMVSRLDTHNCCVFDMEAVLTGGFEMGNMWYNEPNSLDTACDVIADVILSAASQQYGGFTVPNIDHLLAKYALKSYKRYREQLIEDLNALDIEVNMDLAHVEPLMPKMHDLAMKKVEREFEQGFQGWEYRFNTVGSSRGDYPFISMTFGLGTSPFEKMASKVFLRVRSGGQGKVGFKKICLFPKAIFLYDENLHGPGKINEDIFEAGVECSSKAMYPDWLSLSGEGYVADIYRKYNAPIHPMGCRSMVSPWFARGGMKPADENDKCITVGRFNCGVISLNLPMILAKAREEDTPFYTVLDHYLEMARQLHIRTKDYLGNMKASCNPLAYCEGGFFGGHLKPSDKIMPVLSHATFSFGITALEELQHLYNGHSLYEDGEFALEVMDYINKKIKQFTEEDHMLYSIYGTPAESLCGTQVKQFRAKFGVVPGVSDKEFFSNSFHCGVWEDISGFQKQDAEKRFWNLFNGGKIQYVRYNADYNKKAIADTVRRAMNYNFYEGVNFAKCYCDDCGHSELNATKCSRCGSTNLTKIDRACGYLAYSKVKGDTRMNDAKMAEIAMRKSM